MRMQIEGKALSMYVYGGEGEVVGLAGFNGFTGRTGEFGIVLHHPYWKRGYGIEVHLVLLGYGIEQLRLDEIACATDRGNEPMRAFYDKFGLKLASGKTGVPNRTSYMVKAKEWPAVKALMQSSLDRKIAALYEETAAARSDQ